MDFFYFVVTALIGVLAGFLSGIFGIGGAAVTTPLMRLLLNVPGHIALGTPLPLVIPPAVFALAVYGREGLVKVRTGLLCGAVGCLAAVLGASLTSLFSGSQLMLFTSFVTALFAVLLYTNKGNGNNFEEKQSLRRKAAFSVAIGAGVGFLSGFLGIGGGFLMVPLLLLLRKLTVHQAIATSLLAISIYAIPGSIAHLLLGNIDLQLIPLIFGGSIVGAYVGAKKAIKTKGEKLKALLIAFLLVLAASLALHEIAAML